MSNLHCNLGLIDKIIANQINCDKSVQLRWFAENKTCNQNIDNKIKNCFNNCDTCGESVLCIKNELKLLNGATSNCSAFQLILNSCLCCKEDYKQALRDFIVSCNRNNGAVIATMNSLTSTTIGNLGVLASFG